MTDHGNQRAMTGPAIDPAALREAIDFALAHETPWPRDPAQAGWGIHRSDPAPWNRLMGPVHARGPVSGLVQVAGRQVAQFGEPQRSDLTFSVAKTYLALLAGVAGDTGLLPDTDEPVCARVPGAGFDTPHNRAVTWTHLLQQTSEWEGSCLGVPDQVDRYRTLAYQPPREGGAKGDARPLGAPGSFWEYNDVRINQLSLALLHLFGRPLPDVFAEHFAIPLGFTEPWQWVGYDEGWVQVNGRRLQSVPGGSHWGGGISISALDQARVGQMLLDRGRCGGRQLLSPAWIERMTAPCPIAPWYGYLVWRNPQQTVFPGASERSWFAIGAGASITWIDPTRDMVAVVRWIDSPSFDGFCARLSRAVPARSTPSQG